MYLRWSTRQHALDFGILKAAMEVSGLHFWPYLEEPFEQDSLDSPLSLTQVLKCGGADIIDLSFLPQ